MKLSWRGLNYLFLIGSAAQFVGEGHINAFTPLLLQELQLSPTEVEVWTGALFAVMMGTAFPLAPFWGVLAERFSRRWIILRAYYLLAASLLITAWAPDIAFLILGRVLMGLCFGTLAVMISVQSMLTPPHRTGRAIATVQAAMPISASLGPPVGALLIPVIGLRGLFVADAVLTLLAGIAMTALLPEPAERVKRGSVLARTGEVLGLVWKIKPIRWNFISAFLMRGATSVVDSYLPVRITQVASDPASAIGWILGIYGVFTTLATWFLSRIIDRLDVARVYWRSMIVATVLAFGLAVAPALWMLAVLSALRSVPVAFSNTLLFTHKARVLPPELQTAIFSLAPVPRNLGGFVFPLMAAAVAGLAPGGALGLAGFSYVGAFLSGLQLERSSRQARAGVGGVKDLPEKAQGSEPGLSAPNQTRAAEGPVPGRNP